jgi:hypothetical protein
MHVFIIYFSNAHCTMFDRGNYTQQFQWRLLGGLKGHSPENDF